MPCASQPVPGRAARGYPCCQGSPAVTQSTATGSLLTRRRTGTMAVAPARLLSFFSCAGLITPHQRVGLHLPAVICLQMRAPHPRRPRPIGQGGVCLTTQRCPCCDRAVAPPVPMPNRVVKRPSTDSTEDCCGKTSSRRCRSSRCARPIVPICARPVVPTATWPPVAVKRRTCLTPSPRCWCRPLSPECCRAAPGGTSAAGEGDSVSHRPWRQAG
jgi:hypothetical protein